MSYIKKFDQFLKETAAVAQFSSSTKVQPKVLTKPSIKPPKEPDTKIVDPKKTPAKAVTESDVVARFVKEVESKKGSIEKYIYGI
jgi:hypothetical protein